MIVVYPEYYDRFHCIADKCEDTCCAGWEIDIDDKSYEKYMSVGGDFGARLRSCIKKYDDSYEQHGFVLSGEMRCSFLNENNLCDIYKELGEEALCEVCTNTPRNFLEYCDRREISVSASCPEAARLIYGSPDKITFIKKEAPGKLETESDEDETVLGNFLINVRDTAITILQNRDLSLSKRISLFLKHSETVQEAINEWESGDAELPETIEIEHVISDQTSNNNKVTDTSDRSAGNEENNKEKYKDFLIRMSIFSGLASIGDRWKDRMELLYNSFVGDISQDEDEDICIDDDYQNIYIKTVNKLMEYMEKENRLYEYEHLLVYYSFLLLNRSIDDYDYLTKAKLVILSYKMSVDMDAGVFLKKGVLTKEDRLENARIYAREVEHSEENLADLEEELLF